MSSLVLLPAVDVAGARSVRLVGGEAGTETHYGDPLDAALAWQRDGAEWIHLVDLDAAFGRGDNRALLTSVVKRLDVAVQLSGGIRDDASLNAALTTGAARVNLSTAALESPKWVRAAIGRHGDRIVVGLDVKGSTLAARGGTGDVGEVWETLARLDAEGCARYVVSDVDKDGTLTGPNLGLLRAHRRPGRRQRRSLLARRPARHSRADRDRRRGRHRRQSAPRRRIHAAPSPRRGRALSPRDHRRRPQERRGLDSQPGVGQRNGPHPEAAAIAVFRSPPDNGSRSRSRHAEASQLRFA